MKAKNYDKIIFRKKKGNKRKFKNLKHKKKSDERFYVRNAKIDKVKKKEWIKRDKKEGDS